MTWPGATDAVILGGGPAGLAAAIALAQSGHSVLIVTRDQNRGDKIGESLSPAANPILRQLGVWQSFVGDGHLPCYGNKSSWKTADLEHYDFINDPQGHGWHIDRARFEQCLAQRARQIGVGRFVGTLESASRTNSTWHLLLRPGNRSVATRFVLDATGRSSWFARRQGALRRHDDRQVALVAFLHPTSRPLVDSTSLTEAVAGGWWYSARVPDGRLAIALFTDFDLIERRTAITHLGWQKLLEETRYTALRVRESQYCLDTEPRFVPAGSGHIDTIVGDGWTAVGDAAICYDPLSAHGLTLALAGGRDAAAAVAAHLAGDCDALPAYADRLHQAYLHYARMRSEYYTNQMRWPEAPFWSRRGGKRRARQAPGRPPR